ncbi:hypothetical protein [Amycolatopsis sp. BJA-103]|uniref:hypothetical protein n=1 Tax=Amycolatopsis sp. BJA-103 TaxID=1911175 RepID=UPI000C7870E3|nr:hypothetical protein [Amycolatopsis sp. BJA-103]AUI63003.1 hypothetical protein BKN51_35895 [Amycolatopsis sp. BJA-103]PNE18846.1 hypothetical protein B1H26_13595 [Amycolatopsis sp. BJA-103]
MSTHGTPEPAEPVVVIQRGLTGLAKAAILGRHRVEMAQQRAATMTDVAATIATAGSAARVTSKDPDGAEWSLEIIPFTGGVDGQPDVRVMPW